MGRPRLFSKLFATYCVVVLLSSVVVGWLAVRTARDFYTEHTEQELQARAQLVATQLEGMLGEAAPADLEGRVRAMGEASGTRITIISPEGVVLAESDTAPGAMENHRDRPEFKAALEGAVGHAVRHSETLGQDMMYVAVPLHEGTATVAVVRTAVPLTKVDQALGSLYTRIIVGAVLVAAAAVAIGVWASRRVSREIEGIQRGAERFAAGDLSHKVPLPGTRETADLANSLNAMAAELDTKIRTITQQTTEQQAVLTSMVESVLAVDADERVISLNAAAAKLLRTSRAAAANRGIQEVVRNRELQQLVRDTLTRDEPVERDVTLYIDHAPRFLQAHGTVLRDAEGQSIGGLIVLNDVTRLRRLEQVRREFVANVSHEIRTPVTSIKGFAETLLDGAMRSETDSERFLRIIAAQADRLNALVEDLLSLSSLERDAEQQEIVLEQGRVRDVLEVALEACEVKARDRGVTVTLTCDEELRASMNPPLLERAVVNLIDNAIKYSEAGGEVLVTAATGGGRITIAVRDHGCGIGRDHLPRIFERFYRIDKARSRELGGTGLGLAIVKHVAQVHGGTVAVESTLGEGSTFSIFLPVA